MVDAAPADGVRVVAQRRAAAGSAFRRLLLPADAARRGAGRAHRSRARKCSARCSPPFAFDGEDEAAELANATPYGLTAAVWTRDGGRALRMARRIEAGQVFINNYGAGGGIELPFGGMKHSGYGREKAFEGLRGFTTIKTIAIAHG